MADSDGLRAAYRELAEELLGNEEDMIKPESDGLVRALTKGNTLFQDVTSASEGGSEDSRLLAHIAYLGRKKVLELKTETVHFRPMEFVDKVSYFALQGETSELRDKHWSLLGKAVQSFFKKSPTYTFLLGSFATEVKQKKEKLKRQRTKDDNSNDKVTSVTKLANEDRETLETTAHDVTKRVLPQLRDLYNFNGREPIDYYHFVVDPDSFGATVENMFHVSFLIRDGLAEICLDEDGLPAIKPTIYGLDSTLEGRERELQSKQRHQVVNNITMKQWQEIKSAFKIKKARIPRRKS